MEAFTSQTGSAPVQKFRYSPSTDMMHRGRNKQYELQYNADMANWNWQNQIDLMNYQNRYNSPVEQMARFEEAGLNPNFAQGDSGNMASAPTPPDKSASDSQNVKTPLDDLSQLAGLASTLVGVAGGIQGFAKTAADINNTKATEEATRTNTRIGLLRYNMDKTTRELEDAYKAQQVAELLNSNSTYFERHRAFMDKNAADIRKINSDVTRSDALLPFEKESWKLRNEAQGYENWFRKGDVEFDKSNQHGLKRRLAQLSSLVPAQNVPSYMAFLMDDGLADFRTNFNMRNAITGISDSFNRVGSAYNRMVNGIVDKSLNLFNDFMSTGEKYINKGWNAMEKYGRRAQPGNYVTR